MDEDDDDIVFVSESIRTPKNKARATSPPTAATPSPTKKRRLVRGSDEPAKKAKKEAIERDLAEQMRGKKRERDERLISEELKAAARVEDEKKAAGPSASPHRGSSPTKVSAFKTCSSPLASTPC